MKSLETRAQPHARGRRTAGRAQLDHILDPYEPREKLAEGTVCSQCGVVFHEGRWSWAPKPQGQPPAEQLCAACRRTNDKLPAGIITLRGDFARKHKAEIIATARHQEALENKEHPMNRIMSVEEDAEGVTINTTDIHLPRRIGETIKRTWRGKLHMDYEHDDYFVRVSWTREE
jgi:NMD protein affecting ribosome stability and mRNA decay